MAEEFLELQKRLERIRSIYFEAYCEYITFNEVEKLRSPDRIGEEQAAKNLEVLNRYQSFFQITFQALRTSFLSKIAKLVDIHRDSLHLDSLINYIESNREKLTVEEFIRQNSNRPFLLDLTRKYSKFTNDDVLKLRTKLKDVNDIRDRIKSYRDQYLSHEDLNQEKVDIQRDDIYKVFTLVGEILDFITQKIDFSKTTFILAKDDCQRDIKNLIDNLRLGYEYKRSIRKSKYNL